MKLRFRTKTRLFGKPLIVGQIADMVPVNYDPASPYETGPVKYAERWRDATPDDLLGQLLTS
jgi:hypothetical protein